MESPTSSSDHSRWARGRCIGRGSFAAVHIAADKPTGHIFAVKSVNVSNSDQLAALNNEIRILRRLNNSCPYIVQYLGDDTTSSVSGRYRNLHLEYLPGGAVSRETELVVRSYARCLVTALSHLHSRNIVHCDVKGRNVLVGQKFGECKLADFGSAVELEFSSGNERNSPRGSPLWMAPEVLRGEFQGSESDVWSLGCTVIEMLTGKPAWRDQGSNDTVLHITFSDQTPEIPASVSDQCRDFLIKCLRRDPEERWSCHQLLNHPFVSSIVFESPLLSTPRCVLDEFDSNFDDDEEVGLDLNLISVSASGSDSSDSSLAIEKLCCGPGGPVWEEDDGWTTVRKITECSDSVTARDEVGLNRNYALLRGQQWDCETSLEAGPGCGSDRCGARLCGCKLKDVLFNYALSFNELLIESLFGMYLKTTEKLLKMTCLNPQFEFGKTSFGSFCGSRILP